MTMMGSDSFDSRGLRYTDCYGQRFMKPGRYPYRVSVVGCGPLNSETPFVVEVREKSTDGKMSQRTVRLAWDGNHFQPDEPTCAIEAGDLVLWNCPDPLAPPYAVIGEKGFFSSSSLATECGYSHAFGFAGTYEWTDALGKGASGTVVVTDPRVDDDATKWMKSLGQGTLVMIGGGKADPAKVEIVTGQTVFFAVVRGPVTITDRRLVEPGHRVKPKAPPSAKRRAAR